MHADSSANTNSGCEREPLAEGCLRGPGQLTSSGSQVLRVLLIHDDVDNHASIRETVEGDQASQASGREQKAMPPELTLQHR